MRMILVIVACIVVLLSVYSFAPDLLPWFKRDAEIPQAWKIYRNDTYGYSFAYPRNGQLEAYTPQVIALASTTPQESSTVAEVSVIEASEGVSYTNFEDFLYERTRLMCAADGPEVSISCTTVQQEQRFENSAGISGVVYYLEEIHTSLRDNSISSTSVEGPFFAFDLSTTVPRQQFLALVIHPPIPLTPDAVDNELLRTIANSVELHKVKTR